MQELERYSPEIDGQIAYEHKHRYRFAADLAAGKAVLDVACGEGYGAHILAHAAQRVIGVDIDGPTIAVARGRYGETGKIEFVTASCTALPFADKTFDLVVSFETIEHVVEHDAFLAEMRRVLKSDGILVISTPNRVTYSEQTGHVNPFHVKEFNEADFRTLLTQHFKQVTFFSQRFTVPSVISCVDSATPTDREFAAKFEGPAENKQATTKFPAEPQYFVAVCAHRKMKLPALDSFYIDPADDLWLEHQRIIRWASGVHDTTEKLRTMLKEAESRLETSGAIGSLIEELRSLVMKKQGDSFAHTNLREELAGKCIEIERLQQQLDAAQREAGELRDRTGKLADDLAAANNARSDTLTAMLGVQSSLTRTEADIDRLLEQIEALTKNNEEAQNDLRRGEQEIARLIEAERLNANAIKPQLAQIAALFIQIATISETLSARERDNEYARELLTAKDSQLNSLHVQMAESAEKLDAAKERMRNLQSLADNRENELTNAQAIAAEFEQKISFMEARQKAADEAATGIQREMRSRKRELKQQVQLTEQWRNAAEVNAVALDEIMQKVPIVALRHDVLMRLTDASNEVRRRIRAAPLGAEVQGAQLRPSSGGLMKGRTLGWSERRSFERMMKFDAQWYAQQNPDVTASGVDPRKHYLTYGLYEDRDPHPFFSALWYRISAPEPVGDMPSYAHFLADPARKAWPQHPLFDASFYVTKNPELNLTPAAALDHFLNTGARERRDPHPLIDMRFLASQPGYEASENPLLEYLTHQDLYRSQPCKLFDPYFYLTSNSDVARAQTNPLLHYYVNGWREGRLPHPLFAGDWYLASNKDVLSAARNPLEHYAGHGAAEGRAPHPLFDPYHYVSQQHDSFVSRQHALVHYFEAGENARKETTRSISMAEMALIVPDQLWTRSDAITAFMNHGENAVSVPQHFDPDMAGAEGLPQLAWPPAPRPAYWLSQSLRDYIIERFGEEQIPLFLYLMSCVERYGDSPEKFASSAELERLIDRMQILSEDIPSSCEQTDVSIIIPVYNNLVFTLTCIISLLELKTRFRFEILIGDDGSKDKTPEVFASDHGAVRLIRHEKNLGFLGNCNACAAQAKGKYVVFLNNDTLILPGWLDELIGALERDPQAGFAGSKLLNSDGTLQEAGGIFWQDGSAWNFGRNNDPRRPEFNYLKDIDYVSGASIALPRDLWESLDGFDRIFTPAYCEDSDLAFRVRQAGKRTIYVPHSELIHHEGKSHGRETTSGIKAYQIENNKKLLARWQDTLLRENFPNAEHVFLARDRSRDQPHILVIDHYIPQWDRDAGSRTIYHFIRMFLANGFKVTLWPDNLFEDKAYCRQLQAMGVEVIYYSVYLNRFAEFLADNGQYFKYVLASRPHIAIGYYQAIRRHSRAKILFYGHDVHFRRMELEYETHPSEVLEAAIEDMRFQEAENWRRADVTLYPSIDERDLVREIMPDVSVEHVPMLGYSAEELSSGRKNLETFECRDVNRILFVGGSHPPNVDGLFWFVRQVFPLVLTERPLARLEIVGSTVNDDIRQLASANVVVLGRLSDEELEAHYATAGVAIIPLRFGAGVKGKTIEALCNAIPFVATNVGMQGLHPKDAIGFTADRAAEFAQAVLRAQSDRHEARRNVERGLDFIAEYYSINALARAFAPFADELNLKQARQDDPGNAAAPTVISAYVAPELQSRRSKQNIRKRAKGTLDESSS